MLVHSLSSARQDLHSKVGPPPPAVNEIHGSYIVPVTCTCGRSSAAAKESAAQQAKCFVHDHRGVRRLAAAVRKVKFHSNIPGEARLAQSTVVRRKSCRWLPCDRCHRCAAPKN